MRRFLLLALLPMLFFSAFGQNINQGNPFKEKGPENTDQLTVSFTSLSEYVSGTTMNLNFKLIFSSSVSDQADLFRLTFPTGMTPTGGTPLILMVRWYPGGRIITTPGNFQSLPAPTTFLLLFKLMVPCRAHSL